ncbi:MAG TPA: prolyl oligopeptidase family serine peptidase [Longimicrobiales bacterium]
MKNAVRFPFAVLLVAIASTAPAQTARKAMTTDDYARWRSIEDTRISSDGKFVAYTLRYSNALDTKPLLNILNLDTNRNDTIPSAADPAFSDDARWIAYFVELPFEEARKLKDGNKPVPRKAQLLDLQTGNKRTWEDVASFKFADGAGHLLLRRRQQDTKAKHKGVDVIVHNLKLGTDQFLGSVSEASFNRKGELLAYAVDAAEKDANGLFVLDLRNGRTIPLDDDTRVYTRVTWNEEGTAVAALKAVEVEKKSERSNILIAFPDVYTIITPLAKASAVSFDPAQLATFPKDYVLSDKRELLWSADNKRVFIGTHAQGVAPDTSKKKSTDEVADVDVWGTKDVRIQSVQMARAEQDRNFTYRQAYDVDTRRYITLADSTVREVQPALEGVWAIGRDERAYVHDHKRPAADLYRVNTTTGERTLMLKGQILSNNAQHTFGTTPDGRYFLYWNDNRFHVFDLNAGSSRPLAADINFVNNEFDYPGPRPSYGFAGWTADGKGVVVNHKYDLYYLPFDGGAAKNITNGFGAKNEIRFRVANPGPFDGLGPRERARAEAIDFKKPILLTAFGQWTKKMGMFELRNGQLKQLVYDDAFYSSLVKAENADRYVFERETFSEFPDLRVASSSFADMKKITNANPQQSEFLWGRRVLFDYTNSKGVRLQGILAIPDDYKQGEKRPMIVTFYEKNSQNLNRYNMPSFLGSLGSIPAGVVTNGYLTMLPDVHFNTRTSHADMLEAVEIATKKVIEMGYADPTRIGVHGHSYGGEGAAYISTQSKLFAAVGMGAGVTDLTSDFLQPWGWTYDVKGRDGSNAFAYYMYGQGRKGTTIWEDPELYRQESAITHAPKVSQPVLIMHGTADPTVSFSEGLNYYNALRFHEKPAWLLAYPGEGHGLRGLANKRDLTIRYMQFFDHYLKGAPAPRWMTEGVPYLDKDMRRDAAKELVIPGISN